MTIYSTLYHGALRPLYDAARGRPTSRLLREAKQRQWLSPDQLREFQWKELRALLKHAYEFSPWYRARFVELGMTPDDVREPADFAGLPPISREDIVANREEMHATNYRGRTYEHRTGGSTGKPLGFYINRNSYDWRVAVSRRGYDWAGCEEGRRHFYVWGAPLRRQPLRERVKTRLNDAALRREIFSSYKFSEQGMAECVERINKFRPSTLIGYTNALHVLAQHVIEHGKAIAPLGAVITAAEGVNAQQRAAIEKAFRAPIFVSYGSREFMLIAMECEQHAGLHISSDNLYVEVSAGDRLAAVGDAGELLVTDLHNFGMPLIRYRIGDIGVQKAGFCPCGRGLPLLDRVEGRVLDMIRTPDGRVVPGEFFARLFREFDAVKQFQIIQERLDTVVIKVVLRTGCRADELPRLDLETQKVLGASITVNVEFVPEIPLTASGKFRVSVSKL